MNRMSELEGWSKLPRQTQYSSVQNTLGAALTPTTNPIEYILAAPEILPP
jgi:hypothetical protein